LALRILPERSELQFWQINLNFSDSKAQSLQKFVSMHSGQQTGSLRRFLQSGQLKSGVKSIIINKIIAIMVIYIF